MSQTKANLLSQSFEMTFAQDSDCCTTEDQFLKIKTDNGGGGDFYIIETTRWAFDTIDELVEILNRFKEKHEKIKEENL
jgi:hypothetical protein